MELAERLYADTAEEMELKLVEHFQQLSMSSNPIEAARGRFMKEVGPAFNRWMAAEWKRTGTVDDIGASLNGLVLALTNLLMTYCANGPPHPELAQKLFETASAATIAQLGRIAAAGAFGAIGKADPNGTAAATSR